MPVKEKNGVLIVNGDVHSILLPGLKVRHFVHSLLKNVKQKSWISWMAVCYPTAGIVLNHTKIVNNTAVMKKLLFLLFVFSSIHLDAQWYTRQFGVANITELNKEQLNFSLDRAYRTR